MALPKVFKQMLLHMEYLEKFFVFGVIKRFSSLIKKKKVQNNLG